MDQRLSQSPLMDKLCADNIVNKMLYLKSRWADEREYEDFEEYQKAALELLKAEGIEAYRVTKAFAVTLEHEGRTYVASYGYRAVSLKVRK